jgi:glycyl-tRNA synthetase beta chain
MMADFLVEIGTEELPPKSLMILANAFHDHIINGFNSNFLSFNKSKVFATPRRIAVLLEDLEEQAPTKEIVIWGPPKEIAFDKKGSPSKAGKAFAKKNGIPLNSLFDMIEIEQGKEKLCYKSKMAGAKTVKIAKEIIESALTSLPAQKNMRWGSSVLEFVRPIQWIVVLFGNKVINSKIMGQESSNITYGHRFHNGEKIILNTPLEYQKTLREANVIADFFERKELIRSSVEETAKKVGGTAVIGEALLDEVTALNEWPIALMGSFEKKFLTVPNEALISSMVEHQKYFHLVDADGKLLPLFITIANIESKDPDQIILGNERVIRPRLSDAAFFYESDKRTTLQQKREALKTVIFQEKLGSVYEKTVRLVSLIKYIAPLVNANNAFSIRAAEICKSDLVTDMVNEFETLQGVMGKYYASHDGEADEVAESILEHYMPKFSGDSIPATNTGVALALTDRLDTLTGIFGIGEQPTGSKDPFALRRSSLGLLRIIIEHKINVDLFEALKRAAAGHRQHINNEDETCKQVLTYIIDRLKYVYEEKNIPTVVFLSVASRKLTNLLDIHERVNAVNTFSGFPECASLASANKRVSNILSKNSIKNVPKQLNESLLIEPSEIVLAKLIGELEKKIKPFIKERSYSLILKLLSSLATPVDKFFDDVMVMADNKDIRMNRLVILQKLRALFLEVADISFLAPMK